MKAIKVLCTVLVSMALAISNAHASQPDTAIATQFFQQAEQHFKSKDYQAALKAYEDASKVYLAANAYAKLVNTYNKKAETYSKLKDFQSKLEVARLAEHTAHQHLAPKHPHLAQALKLKADAFLSLQQPDSCIAALEQAASLFAYNALWEKEAMCQVGLGVCYYYKGDFQQMEQYLEQAIEISHNKLPSNANEAYSTALHLLGVLHELTGDFDKALDVSKRTLDLRKNDTTTSPLVLANTYTNLGVIFDRKGDYDQALNYYDHALRILKQANLADARALAKTYNYIGVAYIGKGAWQIAKGYLLQSLALYQTQSEEAVIKDLIGLYNNVAFNYIQTQQLDSALFYLDKGRLLNTKDPHAAESILHKYGWIKRLQGAPYDARSFLQEALQTAKEKYGPKHSTQAPIYRELGITYTDIGEIPTALDYFQNGLACLSDTLDQENGAYPDPAMEKINGKEEALHILLLKAKTLTQWYQSMQQQDGKVLLIALRTYALAADLIDAMRQEHKAEGSKQFLAGQAIPLYEAAIETALLVYVETNDDQYLELAFAYAERGKGMLLLESLNEIGARSFAGLPDSLVQLETQLSSDLVFYETKWWEERQKGADGDPKKMELWSNKIFQLKERKDSIIQHFETDYPAYYRLKYEVAPMSVAALQQQVLGDGQSAIITFFVGERQVFVFGLSKELLYAHTLPVNSILQRQIEALRQSIATNIFQSEPEKAFAVFTQSANWLYEALLSIPLRELGPDIQQLYLVPSDILGYVPFEVLLTQPSATQAGAGYAKLPYLFQKYAIAYAYTTNLLAQKASPQTGEVKHNGTLAGFAPTFGEAGGAGRSCADGTFSALTCNQPEVEKVGQWWKGTVFTGTAATKQNFLDHSLNSQIIHLATHACVDNEFPSYNSIYFAQDNLSNAELYNLRLHAQLAVLSACNTGSGKLVKGEGVMSLARGFAYAGCPSMIMSLWNVDDCATSEIMDQFYKELSEGKPKHIALQAAKKHFLATQGKAKSHPYYWAPFVMIGEEAPLESSPWYSGAFVLVWISVILLLLGIIGVWKAK